VKNYGLDGFEVVDNGSGIPDDDFDGITAKHHTSKLKEFSDLEKIQTFGFRGEALSSLCALSNVVITTRDKTIEHGTRLTFDHDGTIKKQTICARNVGTTVAVTDFFITLPVRRGEFLKNYKKDFAKMVQLIQEYCLVLTGVKIICTNQPASGQKQIALSTNGNSVLDNIVSIFTAKQTKDLMKIQPPTEDGTDDGPITQQSLADPNGSISPLDINQPELDRLNDANFKIEGFVSEINSGRPSKDRQFFYINSRPVELKAISKLINDVYHRYNPKQFPFIYLNLKMNQAGVDVNLSKDKRQVAICDDKILQLVVKRSLLNTYGDLPSKFKFVSVNSSVRQCSDESEEDEEDKIMSMKPGSNFGRSLKQWKVNPGEISSVWEKEKRQKKRKMKDEPSGQREPKIKEFFHQKMMKIEER
jgi:DNA mismatch repair protein PMS2